MRENGLGEERMALTSLELRAARTTSLASTQCNRDTLPLCLRATPNYCLAPLFFPFLFVLGTSSHASHLAQARHS